MKTNKSLTIMFAIALWVTSPLANAIYMDSFQGLTFTFDQTDADTLSFNITGTPTGDWSTAQYLGSFDLKDLGLDFSTDTGIANGPGATNLVGLNSQLSNGNNGGVNCLSNGSPPGSICFDIAPDVALGTLPIDFTYIIDFSAPLDISSAGPHLQIAFMDEQGASKKVGSLYSQNVGGGEDVPEPGPLALVSIGLLGLAFSQRKRISNR
jgi:hypothetical protein